MNKKAGTALWRNNRSITWISLNDSVQYDHTLILAISLELVHEESEGVLGFIGPLKHRLVHVSPPLTYRSNDCDLSSSILRDFKCHYPLEPALDGDLPQVWYRLVNINYLQLVLLHLKLDALHELRLLLQDCIGLSLLLDIQLRLQGNSRSLIRQSDSNRSSPIINPINSISLRAQDEQRKL